MHFAKALSVRRSVALVLALVGLALTPGDLFASRRGASRRMATQSCYWYTPPAQPSTHTAPAGTTYRSYSYDPSSNGAVAPNVSGYEYVAPPRRSSPSSSPHFYRADHKFRSR